MSTLIKESQANRNNIYSFYRDLHKEAVKKSPNIDVQVVIAVEAKVRTLLNAEVQSEITSDLLLTRSAILWLLYVEKVWFIVNKGSSHF